MTFRGKTLDAAFVKSLTRALSISLVLVSVAAAGVAGADTDRRTFNDVIYEYIPLDSNYIDSIVAWKRGGTDLDIHWFYLDENGQEIYICSGFSAAFNFERCSFGVIEDVTYYVLVSRYQGLNTPGWINVTHGSSSGTLGAVAPTAGRPAGLRFLGEVSETAQHGDPVFEAARRIRARFASLKTRR